MTEFPKFIKYKDQVYSLVNIDVPDGIPYIILESIGNENKIAKNIYIITIQNPENEIKIVIL